MTMFDPTVVALESEVACLKARLQELTDENSQLNAKLVGLKMAGEQAGVPISAPIKSRANWLPMPEADRLAIACDTLYRAYGEHCYLVGSATERRDYRDVDVRMLLPDEKYRALFGDPKIQTVFHTLLTIMTAQWLRAETGLAIDFQFQHQDLANAREKGRPRNALGRFPDTGFERAGWWDKGWPKD